MSGRSRHKKNHNYITRNTPPPLKAYKMSTRQATFMGLGILVIASSFFLAAVFCEQVAQSDLMRFFKMLASLYMTLLGGLASMIILRIIPANTEAKIKRWENKWSVYFLVVAAVIALIGGWLGDKGWEVVQFYGYAIASCFVGCWFGTDTRKPTEQSK